MNSLPNFKEGDLVLCIESGAIDVYEAMPHLVRGKAYKIKETSGVYLYFDLLHDSGGYYWRRFVKLEDVCVGTLDQEEV